MKKKNLMIAGLGMINAALVASIGLSLAWYSTGAVLYVHQIEVSFRGDKKIYVGLDEDTDNYKETMIFGDKEHSKNYYPISSMFSDEWINEKASKPRFRSEYTSISHNDVDSYTKSDLITVDEDGYFSKEIYLYCESNVILTLDSEQTTFIPDEEGNRKTAHNLASSSNEEEEIYQELNDVVKSLRCSVLIPDEDDYQYYIVDPYKEEDTYLCGLMNYDEVDAYYDSYQYDDERYEFFYGEYNDESKLIYDEPSEEDSELIGRANKFNAKHKAGVHTVNLERSIENGFIPKVEPSINLKEADIKMEEGNADGIRIKLKAFIPTKVVLSLYLEGWDIDNTSLVEQGQFYANIKFKIGEEYFL